VHHPLVNINENTSGRPLAANRDQAEAAESVTLKRVLGVDAVQHAEEITSWNKRAQQNAGVAVARSARLLKRRC
jgi:hypothetical protein